MEPCPDFPIVRSLEVRGVVVPLPKSHSTAAGILTHAPLTLLNLVLADGTIGRSYLFCYTPTALKSSVQLLRDLEPVVVGTNGSPRAIKGLLEDKFRLLGIIGFVGFAIAGIEMAAWDALGRLHGLPLSRLLGGITTPIAAYDSFGVLGIDEAVRVAEESVSAGFGALKVKVANESAAKDIEFVLAIRNAVGPDVDLMIDYNQALDRNEAQRRTKALDKCGLLWIEEPTQCCDIEGHAEISRSTVTAIQLGENWGSPRDCSSSLRAGACDEVMLDVMKIGGVADWMAASAIADDYGRSVSSHLFPEFSAHLLPAIPNARYVEWLDISSAICIDPIKPREGRIAVGDNPGVGMTWNERVIADCAI